MDEELKTFVVIPYKDRMELTVPLVGDLLRDGGFERIILMDNGSSDNTKAGMDYLRSERVMIMNADGMNIHEMWNWGLGLSFGLAGGGEHNVLILNNDISIGKHFTSSLAHWLRSDNSLHVVSPNYDGRAGDGVIRVYDLCRSRYDGTGGLAGFAFMLKGEHGYRFPKELSWWHGDDDLLRTTISWGMGAGIVLGSWCRHLDGGSGGWNREPYLSQIIKDREWIAWRWNDGKDG